MGKGLQVSEDFKLDLCSGFTASAEEGVLCFLCLHTGFLPLDSPAVYGITDLDTPDGDAVRFRRFREGFGIELHFAEVPSASREFSPGGGGAVAALGASSAVPAPAGGSCKAPPKHIACATNAGRGERRGGALPLQGLPVFHRNAEADFYLRAAGAAAPADSAVAAAVRRVYQPGEIVLAHGARQTRFAVLESGRLRIKSPPAAVKLGSGAGPPCAVGVSGGGVADTDADAAVKFSNVREDSSTLECANSQDRGTAEGLGQSVWMGAEDIVGEMALLFRDDFLQVGDIVADETTTLFEMDPPAVIQLFRVSDDLAILYRAVCIKLIERLLALREQFQRPSPPLPPPAPLSSWADPLGAIRRLSWWDHRPPAEAVCRREFEVAIWDVLLKQTRCHATASYRSSGEAHRAVTADGWLFVFEDAWIFRPVSFLGRSFRFNRDDIAAQTTLQGETLCVPIHSKNLELFPRRWTIISSLKSHPSAWLAGGSEFSELSAAQLAGGVPVSSMSRRSAVLPSDAAVDQDKSDANWDSQGRNGAVKRCELERHFLRLLGLECLGDLHQDCRLQTFKCGETVFCRSDPYDAQPFAFVASGLGIIVAAAGEVMDVVRPGSFFGSTQFIQQDNGILPGVRMIGSRFYGADVILVRPEWIWARILHEPRFADRFYRYIAQDLAVRFRRQFGLKQPPSISAANFVDSDHLSSRNTDQCDGNT